MSGETSLEKEVGHHYFDTYITVGLTSICFKKGLVNHHGKHSGRLSRSKVSLLRDSDICVLLFPQKKNTSPWTYIEENLGDMTGMERYHRCAECMEYPHSKGSKYVNISVPWSIWVVISVFWGAGLVFIFTFHKL